MQQYLDLMQDILDNGDVRDDRTGTGTISVFGRQLRFDLQAGFPLLTTKRVFFRGVAQELLWFLSGSSFIDGLQIEGVHIWDNWADEDGDVGPMYGFQWRNWMTTNGRSIDQIYGVIDSLKTNPMSRRHIVSAWNVEDLPHEDMSPVDNVRVGRMALAPCHLLFQFYARGPYLDCQIYQRSADVFLGVPFNIASYALLTHMIADQTEFLPGELIWTGGDTHLYLNHQDQVREQLSRTPKDLPWLNLVHADSIDDYTYDHFELIGYDPAPTIKAPISE